jgi:hypothetical protein
VSRVNQVLSASVIVRPGRVLVDVADLEILEIAAVGFPVAVLADLDRLHHHDEAPLTLKET